jgi:hypothetical protein
MQAIALQIVYSDLYLHILRILVVKNGVHHAGSCREVAHHRATNSIANTKVADGTGSLNTSRCQAT